MSSRSRLPRTSRTLCLVSVSLALVTAACGGGSEASPADTGSLSAPTTDPEITTSPDTEPAPETTAATSTTTTIPVRGASPDDPAPVGDPEFDLIGYRNDVDTVDASMLGLVELALDPEGSNTGRCIAGLSIMTVRETEALVPNPSSGYPRIELLEGDTTLETDFSDCDDSAVVDAGYQTIGSVRAVTGTQVGFVKVVHLDDGQEPTALLLGSTGNEDSRYYELTMLDAVPPLDGLEAGPVPVDLLPTSATDAVRISDSILDSTSAFDVTVLGLLPVERGTFNDDPGRCITVVSTLIGVESPGAIINAFAVPDVHLLAGGRAVEQSIGACDTEPLEALGYFTDLSAAVAIGNTFAVQTSFLLPDGVEPDAIVVGEVTFVDGYYAFAPTALAEVPTAPAREKVNPTVDLVAVGATSAFTLETSSDTSWSGTISGLVPLTNDAVSATCYAVIGEIARSGDDIYPPNIGIIADGAIYGGNAITFANCDSAALVAAGYTEFRDLTEIAADTPTRFFVSIFLPGDVATLGGIAVGNAATDDPAGVVFVEPTVLPAIPDP